MSASKNPTGDISSKSTYQNGTGRNTTENGGVVAVLTVPTSTIANPTEATGVVANPTLMTGTVEASVETYWEPRASSRGDDLNLFLHFFEPASGVLSKRKPKQWVFIREKILPKRSENFTFGTPVG